MPLPSDSVNPLASAPVLVLTPAHPFVLSAHPDRYKVVMVDGEPELLPELARHVLHPGMHGVANKPGQDFDTASDTDAFRLKLASRGEHIVDPQIQIPTNLLPSGVGPGGYIRQITVRPSTTSTKRAPHFYEAWLTYTAPAFSGAPLSTWHIEPYNRWLRWLRDEGHIPAASEAVRARLQANATQTLQRRRTEIVTNPVFHQERVDEAARNVEAVTAAVTGKTSKSKGKRKPPTPDAAESAA